MIIEPRIMRGFVCTTAHPQGCEYEVQQQINYVNNIVNKKPLAIKPKKVLVIGSSTGYGLASRIGVAFGCKADTLGVFFEREPEKNRTASAGWYNTWAFTKLAKKQGLYSKNIIGDAFTDEIKNKTLATITKDWGIGSVDLVIYSLAAPRRICSKTQETFHSVLKPTKHPFTSKTVDIWSGNVTTVTLDPATEQEIEHTVKVMGGEDWEEWIHILHEAKLLAPNCVTLAYSYIGPELTYPIYRDGTIGHAKAHLEKTSIILNTYLKNISGHAYVSVNKAVATQASAAIPVVPLYLSALYKIMQSKGLHENCIQQIVRLFVNGYNSNIDDAGRIRLDDYELREDVQQELKNIWDKITTENINTLTALPQYRKEFLNLFGFDIDAIDYTKDVDEKLMVEDLV